MSAGLAEAQRALLARASEALRLAPGAAELHLFGSLAAPGADAYADLDLQVVSADMARSRAAWPAALQALGAAEYAWQIDAGGDAWAVGLAGASPYHRIDVGLAAEPPAPPTELLWAQPPAPAREWPPLEAFAPPRGSAGHQLLESLISAARYVKSRRRGQLATCWRFMRSHPERLLQLLDERSRGWEAGAPLTTWDYKRLDAQLGAGPVAEIMARLDWSSPARMDSSFLWFLGRGAGLLLERAASRGERIPGELVRRHLAFARAELGAT